MEGASSRFNNSTIFINAFFLEVYVPGINVDCLLCNEFTMLSASRRKILSRNACGIGICRGIIVALSVILSLCVLGMQQVIHL